MYSLNAILLEYSVENPVVNHIQESLYNYVADAHVLNSRDKMPEELHRLNRKGQDSSVVHLDWHTIKVPFEAPITDNFRTDVKEMMNKAFKEADEKVRGLEEYKEGGAILSWLGEHYRKAVGNFMTNMGGFGSIISPFNGLHHGIFAHIEENKLKGELLVMVSTPSL